MDEQMPLRICKDMGGKEGVLQHTHMVSEPHSHMTWTLKWSTKVFWVCLLHVCIKNKEKPTISTCANTAIPPKSCLFPPLCKTGISKDTLVPKHSAAVGGAPTCRHSIHTQQKVGVTRDTFLTTITHGALKLGKNAVLFTAHTNTHTRREISAVLLPLCGRYFLTLAYRQPWQQWAGLLSQLLDKK